LIFIPIININNNLSNNIHLKILSIEIYLILEMSKIAKKSIITNLINIKTIKIIKTIKTIKTIKIIKITQIISLYRHNYLKTI
jgi:hypothetical protein